MTYLGLKLAGGPMEAFPLNYDGILPREHSEFRGQQGHDTRDFLRRIAANPWRPTRHLMHTHGTRFVLTSTDMYPYFSTLFGLKGALLLSHMVLVDADGAARVSASKP
jgi:hypothetical protein